MSLLSRFRMFIRDMRIRMRAKYLPAPPSQGALVAADIVASIGTAGAPNTNGWDHLFCDAVSIHGVDEEEWETTSYEEAQLMATVKAFLDNKGMLLRTASCGLPPALAIHLGLQD
jgi:hypothetical protein